MTLRIRLLSPVAVVALFSIPQIAFAYLDPGTGSMLLQGLLALVGGTVATIAMYWRSFKTLLRRLLRGTDRDRDPPASA
ncbi:MAG TPA: hypothetical protein VHP37_02985 [Burkholderiales bacterium]|nr:hypothetical protein [Burkholderiales bacterium]